MKQLALRGPIEEKKRQPGIFSPLAGKLVRKQLEKLVTGRFEIHESGDVSVFGAIDDEPVVMVVEDVRAWEKIAFGGVVGAAEAYMLGYWNTPDLTGMIRVLLRNRFVLDGIERQLPLLKKPLYRFFHWLHRDTMAGSRKNITAHYDLGNELFGLFLDPTLTYSSGYFLSRDDSMECASVQKLDLICRKLDLGPGDRVLEIGSGWGSFAVHAARNYGCHVTTTTISKEQYEYVTELVDAEGLGSSITVLNRDYRLLEGSYDKIVSVEMIEAVGLDYLPAFFAACSALLKEGGSMLLQSITIADQRYEKARRSVDFIQRYIFPGGALPSVSVLSSIPASHTDLRLYALEDITSHYAETIGRWKERFRNNLEQIRDLGCHEVFLRMWDYYLCYCEAGFRERAIGCVHMQYHKPGFSLEIPR